MKKFAYSSFVFVIALPLLVACAPAAKAACESADGLANALRIAGASVESAEQVNQEFFSVPAQRLVVNREDIQVFAYSSEDAASLDAGQVGADGSSIGTTMLSWIDTPHFFQCGKLIVLYLGHNVGTLSLLERQLGAQFAGG